MGERVETGLSRIGYTHPKSRGLHNPDRSKNSRTYNYLDNLTLVYFRDYIGLYLVRYLRLKLATFLMGDRKWVQFWHLNKNRQFNCGSSTGVRPNSRRVVGRLWARYSFR